MLGANDLIACPNCDKKESVLFKTWPYGVCKKCEKDPKYIEKKKRSAEQAKNYKIRWSKQYRTPTGFGVDKKTGRPIAVDKKGKKFDIKDTRYNLRKDPFGWRAVGKKVRPTDKYGRPQ